MDYSENYPHNESERCHTKHDEDIPRDEGQQPSQHYPGHKAGGCEFEDILWHGLSRRQVRTTAEVRRA